MLGAKFMISPNDRPFKQTPNILDAVGMKLPSHIFFLGVIDGFVIGVEIRDPLVTDPFIRNDHLGFRVGVFFNKLMEGFPISCLDDLQADLPAPLDGSHNDRLAGGSTSALSGLLLSAYPSLVNFHGSAEFVQFHLRHGFPDSMTEIPSGFVRNPEGPLHLVCGHSLLGFDHQIHSGKPLPKRKVGVVEDRSANSGELVAA